jgi:antitoxin component of RelBE/YafQ-DinJ toxin-antitoxin module
MSANKNTAPKFKSETQEAEYWDKHSPLDLIAEPELEKVRVGDTKDRPIAIRLDSKTRSKLNELAAKQGMGPSTLARLFITQAIEGKENSHTQLDLDVLMKTLTHNINQVHEAKGVYRHQSDIIDAEKAPVLVYYGQKAAWEHFSAQFLAQLLCGLGVCVVTPDNGKSKK